MSYQYGPPLEVSDFSGGKTDFYIEGPINQGQEYDNLLVKKDKKPKSRDGLTFYVSAAQAQLPAGNSRPSALIKHLVNRELFAQTARSLYYVSSSTWTALTGPVSSNSALGAGAVTNFCSWADWRGHTIITSDSFCDPIKVYRNESSVYQVRNAGMPKLTLEGAIDLANSIKTQYNLHRVDATEHATGDTTNVVAAAAATDLDTLITLVTELLTDYAAHRADAALAAAWAYHVAQEATSGALSSAVAPTTLAECLTRLDDLKTKFNIHDADATTHDSTASEYPVTVNRLPQVSASGTGNTYLYKFLYYYQYYVDDVLHEDFGPTTDVTLSNVGSGTKSITEIPAIANGTTRCYDTDNIKVYIYRTIAAGTDYYLVGSVTNGTTTYSDTTSDATLVLNTPLYTTGGVLDNDPPPRAKYFTAVNDIGVYANLKIGSKNYPNSFTVSIPGDVDSCPESFQDEVEAEITGLNNFGIYPMLFCRSRIYRLEGIIDEQGRGSVFKREVSRTKGSISNNGIVQIPQGLVFPGEDGFYFCDGFNPPQALSIHLINTYKSMISVALQEKRIYGEYDSLENRVHWTVNQDTSVTENQSTFVLDLNFPLSEQSVFVTASGQGTAFQPSAMAFYNKTMVHADSRGYILKYDSNTATDLKIDTSVAASSWTTYAILYDYKSCAYNFGTNSNFKWVPIITLETLNDVNSTIQIKSNNEDSFEFSSLKEIRNTGLITWGDASAPSWSSTLTGYRWRLAPLITAKRRFPAGGLRCMLKQVQITNAYTIIYNSDTYGTATIADAANTATISGTFPTDITDYYISFITDSYTADFQITSRDSATQITFLDPTGVNVTASGVKWVIRGYKKGEKLNLVGYQIPYAIIGKIHTTWKGVDGANA